MIIRVNEQELNYEIGKEKNLGEVLESLEEWVGREGGVVQKVTVDGIDLSSTPEPEFIKRDVSEISMVEVAADSEQRHAAQTLSTLGEYILITLDTYFDENVRDTYDDLMCALGMIIEAAEQASRVLGLRKKLVLSEKGTTLDGVLTHGVLTLNGVLTLDGVLGTLAGLRERFRKRYLDEEGLFKLRAALQALVGLLPKMLKWAVVKNTTVFSLAEKAKSREFFVEVTGDIQSVLENTEGLFEKIAENLQIGNDGEALADIYCITEILDECIVLLRAASEYGIEYERLEWEGNKTEAVFVEISHTLREAMEALDLRDMVSVGDLMEFEIRPHWRKVAGLLGSMRDLVEINDA